MEICKLRCKESLRVGGLLSIIFILILAMFSFFFRSARRQSRAGMMEVGFVTEERVVPGRQSSLYLCLHTFKIHFVLSVCIPKTLLEFKDFSLLHI